MKQLILSYSHSGNNALLANHLETRLGADHELIRERRGRSLPRIIWDMARDSRPSIFPVTHDPARYEHIILVAPVWDRQVAHPMKSALEQVAPSLDTYSFVTLCGFEREGQPEMLRAGLSEIVGMPPQHVLQLLVADLLAPEFRQNELAISRRKVSSGDLEFYKNQIAKIESWTHHRRKPAKV